MLITALLVFAKVGLLTIGGGLAMIPLLQDEIVARGWISLSEFTHMISIAEMTPGPIIVNLATYVGFRLGGVVGAVACTLGVMFPSFVIVTLVSSFLSTHWNNRYVSRVFAVVRPVVVGLIASAGLTLAGQVLLGSAVNATGSRLDVVSSVIFLVATAMLWKADAHPIKVIGMGAVLGMVLFSIIG